MTIEMDWQTWLLAAWVVICLAFLALAWLRERTLEEAAMGHEAADELTAMYRTTADRDRAIAAAAERFCKTLSPEDASELLRIIEGR